MSFALSTVGVQRTHSARMTGLLFMLLMLPALACAALAERAGRVLATTGGVEAVAADGTARSLQRRADVYSGETLRTAGKARAQVRFTDGALLSLRPDSELKIDEYHFENRDAVDHKYLRLVRGGFRTVTGSIGRTNRAAYRVSTPLAVIGVRGTDWEVLQQSGGPLLLGVNQGGITAQSVQTNQSTDVGSGTAFNYAQVALDGSVQLLPEAPAALVQSATVEKGEKPAEEKSADGEKSGSAEEKGNDLAADANAAPPPPAGGGDTGTGTAPSNDPASSPPPPSVNPADMGAGTPPTTVPLSRVFTTAEVDAIVADTHLALVSGLSFSANGQPRTAFGLVGPSVDDAISSFNFAFRNPGTTLPGTDRLAGVDAATHFIQRQGVAISGVQNNVGGIAGLTFGQYVPATLLPLPVFLDANNSANNFALTTPFVFALFDPTSIASLTGRFVYSPTANLIAVATGTVSTVIGELVLNVNLGTGAIDRGVLDVGYGATPDAFVFVADLRGSVANVNGRGVLNATVGNIVLQDNTARQTLAARGTVSGAFTGSSAIPGLTISFDYADNAGRNQFARGVVLFSGKTVPPPPSLALSPGELTQLQSGFFFVGTDSQLFGGPASGPATDARLSLGRPLLTGNLSGQGNSDLVMAGDPRFASLPPDVLVRQSDAPTVGFRQSFNVVGTQSLSWGQWTASTGAPVRILDSATGLNELDRLTVPLFWATAMPKSLASLTGITTFSSNGGVDFQGVFGPSSGQRFPILDVSTSFAVDFGTGAIRGGHFFAVTERNATGDLGFEVDFVGNVVSSGGRAFATFTATSGAYRANTPLDPQFRDFNGLFTGAGAQTSVLMSFFAQSAPPSGLPDFVSGTLVIGQANDARLTANDVAFGLERVGIAVFSPVDSQGAIIATLPHNAGPGLLLGRGGDVNPANTAGFGLFANNVASVGNARFLALPADYVLRQDSAAATRVDPAVGGDSDIGWGEWLAVAANPQTGAPAQSAGVQGSAANAAAVQAYNADVLFASVIPTPGVLSGTAVYSGSFDGATGTGSLSLLARGGTLGGPTNLFDSGALAVNVDFNTGLVNGNLQVSSAQTAVQWDAGFSGRLNRNIAELSLNTLQVTTGSGATAGSIGSSSVTGVVSGLNGDQFVGGFQFVGGGEHVEGLMRAGKQ